MGAALEKAKKDKTKQWFLESTKHQESPGVGAGLKMQISGLTPTLKIHHQVSAGARELVKIPRSCRWSWGTQLEKHRPSFASKRVRRFSRQVNVAYIRQGWCPGDRGGGGGPSASGWGEGVGGRGDTRRG